MAEIPGIGQSICFWAGNFLLAVHVPVLDGATFTLVIAKFNVVAWVVVKKTVIL